MSWFRQSVHSFANCARGNIGILFALTIVPIAGAAGIAIDYRQALNAEAELQAAVDAAAVSAAKSAVARAERSGIAQAVFNANMKTSKLASGATSGVTVTPEQVTVSATVDVPTTLMSILGYTSMNVNVQSIASMGTYYGTVGSVCVLSLSGTANSAFYGNGTTLFEAIDCAVYSNSEGPESLRAVGTPSVSASSFCTVGGFDVSSDFLPMPTTDCSPLPDPLAGLTAPASDDCDASAKGTSVKQGEHTLSPGTFCGGLETQANADVTFEPGIYVIKNGPLNFKSQSISAGTGVMFYLTGSDAALNVDGGATVDFQAPTSGPYAGLMFVQDRDSNAGATSIVQGGGTVNFVGALYFPTQTLEISGNGDIGQDSDAWTMIADMVQLKGNGTVRMKADYADAGMPDPIALPDIVGPRLIN